MNKKFGLSNLVTPDLNNLVAPNLNNSDFPFAISAVLAGLAAVWGVRNIFDIMYRPSKLELFMYSYTIKSKRKYKKVKFRKSFNKKYILSDSRLKEISKYNREQKEKKITACEDNEKNRQYKLNILRKKYNLPEIDYKNLK